MLKKFKVTDGESGGVSYTDGPNKGNVIEDLQRMGCFGSGTTVEEVDPANHSVVVSGQHYTEEQRYIQVSLRGLTLSLPEPDAASGRASD